MADRLLICISAEQAVVSLSRGVKLGPCQVFRNDDAGFEAFDRYVATLRNVPVHVMVDVVEEDYRFEMLPHAGGRDRSELIERRLRQLYRNTSFCAAQMQGRDADKRRDDQYLFFALTNPDPLNAWLAVVRAHDLPVAGVYLQPIIAQALVQKIAPDMPNLLLVSLHASGLRLSFFRQGRLRISRLTRVDAADPRGRVTAYTEEIANTRLYLHALRVMTLDEHLAVVVLDRDGSLAGLEQAVARDTSNAQAELVDNADIAKRSGVPAAIVHDLPEALYLHFLGMHRAGGNLAPEPVTERFQIYQLRRALYATAGIVGAVSLIWTAMNTYQIYDLRSQREHAASQTMEFQRRYQDVTRQFPASPTSADNLVQAVQIAERLRTMRHNPEQAMIAVSRVFEQYPGVFLKSFGWKYSTQDFDSGGGGAPSPAPPSAQAAAPAAPGTPPRRRHSAYVEAEIRPFDGDFRSALDAINRFAETLRADATVAQVKVVALPLNVSPTMALSGSTAEAVSQATTAPFRLHVVFKPTS